ncbi:hypothetical protein HNV08_14115 [Winogradskyella eckloniae]|nr:hypothetical protein [Winogradskyella eckloniae]NRD21190.1 hypothetical protein [Winogradskyella eckloniae]
MIKYCVDRFLKSGRLIFSTTATTKGIAAKALKVNHRYFIISIANFE